MLNVNHLYFAIETARGPLGTSVHAFNFLPVRGQKYRGLAASLKISAASSICPFFGGSVSYSLIMLDHICPQKASRIFVLLGRPATGACNLCSL